MVTSEYSIYQTSFVRGPVGLPVCIVIPPSGDFNPIQNLQSIGSNDQVKYLYSPGYLEDVPYGNQLLVTYNVQCPSYHVSFISLLYADIEPASCLDRCVDYILVDRQVYGVYEACGNETGQLQYQLELGTFMVNFRTSPSIQHSGFLAKVVCFLHEDIPPADCSVADNNTIQFAPTFSEGSVYFSEEQIHIARSFENACNPVLRAEAVAILQNYYSVRNQVCPQCHLNAECYNSVTCTCREGFYGNGHFCADYDECSSGLNNCSDDADCINNQGSFMCSCHKSFNGNGITCLSTERGNSSCNVSDPNCVCFENDCKCKVGYELIQNDGMTSIICKDIDECLHDPCMDIQFCKNTDGSYVCTCTSGYVYNIINGTCDDFDECRFEFSDCDKNAKCTNLNGSFDCTCNAGFTGNGKSCYSTDELCEDALDCQQTCIGSADYFGCTCWPGYILALDQKSCQDINECLLSYDNCDENASCNNTEGGFSCTCNPGYYGNGQFCVDIDECKAGEYQCDVNAKCINTVGNYSCQCQPPYNGDGFTCSRGPVIQRDQRIDRPNHHLYYPIGVDFCLEESFDSYHFTINCPLQSPVFPVAEFQFSITQTYSGINVPISNYTVTNISEIAQSLSVIDSSILTGGAVTVYCRVSNSNGNDSAKTLISVCGPNECQDGVTNNCTQYCTRNISENGTVYLCSCDEGFIFINGQCERNLQ